MRTLEFSFITLQEDGPSNKNLSSPLMCFNVLNTRIRYSGHQVFQSMYCLIIILLVKSHLLSTKSYISSSRNKGSNTHVLLTKFQSFINIPCLIRLLWKLKWILKSNLFNLALHDPAIPMVWYLLGFFKSAATRCL